MRRISELREQCSLEQQAKAHLEAALRLEMDELQCVVKTLTTKIELQNVNAEPALKNGNAKNEANLIQLDQDDQKADTTSQASSSEFSSPISTQSTDLDKKIQELETQLKAYKEQVMEKEAKIIVLSDESQKMKTQLAEANNSLSELKAKDDHNTITVAENKMVIHSELETREKESKVLKEKVTSLESELLKASKENREMLEQVNGLKKQLLEAKTISQANNEVMKEKLKELEAALKASGDEKHKLELKFLDVERSAGDHKQENIALKETINTVKDGKHQLDDKYTNVKKQISLLQDELKNSLAQNDILRANLSEIFEHLFKEKDDGSIENIKRLRDYAKEVASKLEKLMSENKCLTEDKSKIEQRLKEMFDDKQEVVAKLKLAEDNFEKNLKEMENLKLQVCFLLKDFVLSTKNLSLAHKLSLTQKKIHFTFYL